MHRGLVWLVASCVLVMGAAYTWSHRQHVIEAVAAPAGPVADVHTPFSESDQEAAQMVTLTGPLADYMTHQNPGQMGALKSGDSADEPRKPYHPTEMDRVGDSPVGTSTPILHKTFPVVALVNLPFDIPPHAASPQFKGTYHSFLKGSGAGSENAADVELLLMNQQQFTDLLNGHASDAVFSTEDAHDQEVNTSLPPTFNDPARYYLVFRNNSRERGKKFVKADFQVDF